MPELSFYHLLHTPLEQALPILLQKILSAGKRVHILTASEVQTQTLDEALWASTQSFIPHGTISDNHSEKQPIIISESIDKANNADVLLITSGVQLNDFHDFLRILDMFDGGDETALQAARSRWKSYKERGVPLQYIQQQQGGGWKEMASENQAETD